MFLYNNLQAHAYGAGERKIVYRVLSRSVNLFQYAHMICSAPLSLSRLYINLVGVYVAWRTCAFSPC